MKTKTCAFLAYTGLFFLLGTTPHAALIRPLNDLQVIEVSISQQDLTRIAVKDDRILNVFGVSGEYVLEADEDYGQLFIRPTNKDVSPFETPSSKPIHLTLVTEKGHTQDLRLIPKDQAPEALILKEETQSVRGLAKKTTSQRLTREDVETLLQACRRGDIPLGYTVTPRPLLSLKTPYLLTREVRGEKLKGLIYEVKNSSSLPFSLSERAFAASFPETAHRIIAIFMPVKTLKPGERSFVYVVEKL